MQQSVSVLCATTQYTKANHFNPYRTSRSETHQEREKWKNRKRCDFHGMTAVLSRYTHAYYCAPKTRRYHSQRFRSLARSPFFSLSLFLFRSCCVFFSRVAESVRSVLSTSSNLYIKTRQTATPYRPSLCDASFHLCE